MDASTFAAATALSTAAGFRPFLSTAVIAWLMYAGYLHPSAQFQWLGSPGDAALLSLLAAVEFVADKIPIVDHALHVVHFAAKPVLAALVAGASIPGGDPQIATYVTMGVAALNALGVHVGLAGTRAASTTFSLGLANPVLSVLEDIFAVAVIAIALFVPFLGLAISVAVLFAVVRASASVRALRRKHAQVP